jgi:hypothetical protein
MVPPSPPGKGVESGSGDGVVSCGVGCGDVFGGTVGFTGVGVFFGGCVGLGSADTVDDDTSKPTTIPTNKTAITTFSNL